MKQTLKTITANIAVEYDIPPAELRGPRKFKTMVEARDEIIKRARLSGYSLVEIGNYLGGRHHTTILFSATKTGATTGRDYR